MRHSLTYGIYLGIALILSYLLYYLLDQYSLFYFYGKAMVWEFLLLGFFIFFAISKNKNAINDSGISFKIALYTLVIGLTISGIFRYSFSYFFAEKLNPTYLEAKKAEQYYLESLFGNDPLGTLERVELMENTIKEDYKISQIIAGNIMGFFIMCIPFSILMGFISRQILKFDKQKILSKIKR